MARVIPCLVVCLVAATAQPQTQDLEATLEKVHELVTRHRYQDVVELLQPLSATIEDLEAAYAVSAELGRAHFHLGHYRQADGFFRRAVSIHPERIETAVYLQASSFLIGNRDQALMIFREVVRSGATDLYLSVTLPGERGFLADPQVWSIIDEHAQELEVDIDGGGFIGVRLGQARSVVEHTLGSLSQEAGSTSLAARAGPMILWAMLFDEADTLAEVLIDAEHLLKYTPYRLRLGDELGWNSPPAETVSHLGPPLETTSDDEGGVSFTWQRGEHRLTLDFGRPEPPVATHLGDGTAVLRSVRMWIATTAPVDLDRDVVENPG